MPHWASATTKPPLRQSRADRVLPAGGTSWGLVVDTVSLAALPDRTGAFDVSTTRHTYDRRERRGPDTADVATRTYDETGVPQTLSYKNGATDLAGFTNTTDPFESGSRC
ncbi:MAG: hypothetical protein WAW88_09580 [Nocardioides sp.]